MSEPKQSSSVQGTSPLFSVVVPVYSCAPCLRELCNRLGRTLSSFSGKYEIILVNDSSPDNAWQEILKLSEENPRVKGVNFSRNFGQHSAILAGLDEARGEWVVVMDGDLQDAPEEIPKLYSKALEGFDIVQARRADRRDPLRRRIFSWLYYKVLSYLVGTRIDHTIANFGIYHRKVIDVLIGMREQSRFFPLMIYWVGFSRTAVDVDHAERPVGESSYNLRKMLKLAMGVIIAFSDKPLQLAVKLGFLMASTSFCFAVYLLVKALLGYYTIEGWASLIVSVWFLSGLIIMTLGVLGYYVGKTFDEAKKRPLYIVSDRTWKH